jgi:hypothetical protein
MFPYLNCDRIEDRRWVEQQLSEEREKWIDDRAKEIIASFPTNPTALVACLFPQTKSLMRDSAAIRRLKLTTILCLRWLMPGVP